MVSFSKKKKKRKKAVFVLLMEKEFKQELLGQTVWSSPIINIFLRKQEPRNNSYL